MKDVIETENIPFYDPWALKPDQEKQDPRFSYLEKTESIRPPITLKEAPISLAAGKGTVPAVPAPNPGTSYNPVFQDWDALITAEGEKEVEAEKERLREEALERERLARIAALTENEQQPEMGVLTEEESAWEGFESDLENVGWLNRKRPERKTPSERNRVRRRKEAERRDEWERKERNREKQERRVGDIVRAAKEEAKRRELLSARDEEEGGEEADDRVLRRRKLGKDVYDYCILALFGDY